MNFFKRFTLYPFFQLLNSRYSILYGQVFGGMRRYLFSIQFIDRNQESHQYRREDETYESHKRDADKDCNHHEDWVDGNAFSHHNRTVVIIQPPAHERITDKEHDCRPPVIPERDQVKGQNQDDSSRSDERDQLRNPYQGCKQQDVPVPKK